MHPRFRRQSAFPGPKSRFQLRMTKLWPAHGIGHTAPVPRSRSSALCSHSEICSPEEHRLGDALRCVLVVRTSHHQQNFQACHVAWLQSLCRLKFFNWNVSNHAILLSLWDTGRVLDRESSVSQLFSSLGFLSELHFTCDPPKSLAEPHLFSAHI